MRDRKEILSVALDNKAECVLVLDDSNRHWVTGFRSSAGVAIITKDETALFLDARYTEKAYAEKPDATIYPCTKGIISEACSYIEAKNLNSVAVDESTITVADYKRLENNLGSIKLTGVKDIFSKFRAIKTAEEISFIKEAVRITDECFSHVLSVIRKGITEADVAAEINYYFHKQGCENAFETIAVSGVKSSMPHGTPDVVPLTENSFLTMDFGAKYRGYCADLTRTVVLGRATEEMKKIYSIVLEANRRGIEKAKYGVLCKDVDFSSRDYISQNGYGDCFGHSTGHSFGIDIHELPSVSKFSEEPLKEGNVVTIEPGIYIPEKYGVRIEDTVLILKNETIVLSKSPKELIEI